MLLFFWIAALSLFVFQLFLLYSIDRRVRIWILSHKTAAAITNMLMSLVIMAMVGVGSIVGMANLFASTALAAYMIIAGRLMRQKARLSWRRFLGIPLLPGIEVYGVEENEAQVKSDV